MTYTTTALDAYFYTMPGFYVFFIPLCAPYKKIYAATEQAGFNKKEAFGPILESAKMFGWGFIGIEIEKATQIPETVVHIQGEFKTYEHRGPYRTLGKAYKMIMKDHPQAKQYYNLYLDDPRQVPPSDLRTRILFR